MRDIKTLLSSCVFVLLLALLPIGRAAAQYDDAAELQLKGKHYLDINLRHMERLDEQIRRRQHRLLRRLIKRERRLRASLTAPDTAAWAMYAATAPSFDSIRKLAERQSSGVVHFSAYAAARLDSLRCVSGYLERAASATGLSSDLNGYDGQIQGLRERMGFRNYIDDLISRRAAGIGKLGSGRLPGIQSINKDVFYAKAQLGYFKALADDPDKAEARAYEFLRGQPGFEEGLSDAVGNQHMRLRGASGPSSEAELERLGYQTRRQVSAALQQKLGSNMAAVQQQVGSQINTLTAGFDGIQSEVKNVRRAVGVVRSATISKTDFKVNPVRCLPLRQRFETTYDFQTSRPTAAGAPAILRGGYGVSYKQSENLTAGVSAIAGVGLGDSWKTIRLSFQGVGGRIHLNWALPYKLGLYAGYEILAKPPSFGLRENAWEQPRYASPHNRTGYAESALIGLTRMQDIGGKRSSFQLLYDLWWKEKQLNSPFIVRISKTL